ncbi:MAG: AAA family ATPase [Thomasclavelia sp.]
MVDFSSLVDSKLGQTQKNISTMFKEINNFTFPDKIIILFDEIDALALDRTNSNDLREMGRATWLQC